jgi:hypothetical protein
MKAILNHHCMFAIQDNLIDQQNSHVNNSVSHVHDLNESTLIILELKILHDDYYLYSIIY